LLDVGAVVNDNCACVGRPASKPVLSKGGHLCTFYTRLVTSRLLVKWCSVSKPVLVKPALNPIYTSINTGVNNTGLNKTGVYDALLIFQCYGLGILLSKAVCPSWARALMPCNPMSELGPAT
jgi:hypothetical protein